MIYTIGLIPYTLYSLAAAMISFPRYADKRHYILSHSPHGRFWLLRELLKGVPPYSLAVGVPAKVVKTYKRMDSFPGSLLKTPTTKVSVTRSDE